MTTHSDNETAKNEANNESGIPEQEATIPETPTPTSPSNPETDNMEVHHHSHGHAHGRKTWKNYFWEFMMLFLAVFCGFLAEYYLEHRIEKERGKQFIESFYNDLKTDTARISYHALFDEEKIRMINNLDHCYDALLHNINDASCMLELIKYSSVNRPFVRTERTLKQLANAGGFRLLHTEDADSIVAYDKNFNDFQDFQSTVFQEAQNNVRNTFNTLGSFKANVPMFKPEKGKTINTESFSSEAVKYPILFSGDKNLLNKYFNELLLYYRVTYNHRNMLLALKAQQSRMIDYFRTKYHFE
jgi:hypothetical protein